MTRYRQGLPPVPERMRHLRVDSRGYPIPWFVAWVNGEPEFRAASTQKFERSVRFGNCWVCGEPTGKARTFVIGPMCAVNCVTSEPPCHIECARFSATACPFLTLPKAKRNEANLPAEKIAPAGEMIPRNPGVACLWTTGRWKLVRVHNGMLYNLGEPSRVEWFAHARPATRDEVWESISSGLPLLQEAAVRQGPSACTVLERQIESVMPLLPL